MSLVMHEHFRSGVATDVCGDVADRLARLIKATAHGTGCADVGLYLHEDKALRSVAWSGSAADLTLDMDPAKLSASATACTVLHEGQADGYRLLKARQPFAGFAAVLPFSAAHVRGAMVVAVADAAHDLSPAQSYFLEAQVAHAATLLEFDFSQRRSLDDVRDAALAQSQRLRLLESVAVHARDSIVITEAEPVELPGPRILYCNAAFTRATGYAPEEVIGKTPRVLQGPDTCPHAREKLRRALAAWEPVEVELINYRKDGTPFWVELSIVPVADETGWFTHWVSVQRDVTERKAAEQLAIQMRVTQVENEVLATEIQERKRVEAELLYTAFHDNLTRLRNRAFFMQRLSEALDRQNGPDGIGFAVLFLDLDRFKVVNDSLGHVAGDTLLKEIARRLKACVRAQDTLARIGGDEFAVLIEDASELQVAIAAAERIIARMRPPVRLGRQEVFPACSIGIVRSSPSCTSPEALLRDADIAMYEAKREGHGDYAVFDESMHARAVQKLNMQTDLRRAIDRCEFRVEYQPIVELASGRVAGFEALLRWNHPVRGLVPPADFVDVAEDLGLIRQIDRWVRTEAARDLARWQREFDRPDLRISVNTSASEFAEPEFVAEMTALLAEHGLAAETLQLEITEGVFLHPTPVVIDTMAELRRRGIRIALDDFGTGYSSLSYLNRYSVDTIKIDKSFVAGMSAAERTSAIVELIVSLGRTLGIGIVAEGVEAAQEEALLSAIGCGYGQGFRFSRPLPAADAAALLANDRPRPAFFVP